jgi:hypothetical protein
MGATGVLVDVAAVNAFAKWADVVLLRPASWLERHGAAEGHIVDIQVPECGISGGARVLRIEPCPKIRPGKGSVITGTFKHVVSHVLDLYIQGEAKPLGTTPNHLFWCEDAQAFLRADELLPGQLVRTTRGPRPLLRVLASKRTQEVFNLEVQSVHIYHVGPNGILVHNARPCPAALTPYNRDGHHIFSKRAFEGLEGYDLNAALSLSKAEMKRLGFDHGVATARQQELFLELGRRIAAGEAQNTLAEHARIATESLIAGGLSRSVAERLVTEAQAQITGQFGLSAPSNWIPWYSSRYGTVSSP